jgi:hypothetical protein
MIISHISSSDPLSDNFNEMLIEDQGGQAFVNDQIFSPEDTNDDVHHYLTNFEEIKEEEADVNGDEESKEDVENGKNH